MYSIRQMPINKCNSTESGDLSIKLIINHILDFYSRTIRDTLKLKWGRSVLTNERQFQCDFRRKTFMVLPRTGIGSIDSGIFFYFPRSQTILIRSYMIFLGQRCRIVEEHRYTHILSFTQYMYMSENNAIIEMINRSESNIHMKIEDIVFIGEKKREETEKRTKRKRITELRNKCE